MKGFFVYSWISKRVFSSSGFLTSSRIVRCLKQNKFMQMAFMKSDRKTTKVSKNAEKTTMRCRPPASWNERKKMLVWMKTDHSSVNVNEWKSIDLTVLSNLSSFSLKIYDMPSFLFFWANNKNFHNFIWTLNE